MGEALAGRCSRGLGDGNAESTNSARHGSAKVKADHRQTLKELEHRQTLSFWYYT